VGLGAGTVTTTAGVFLFGVGSVDDVLLVHGWGWRQHVFLVLGPGFITGLPFLLSSIFVVRAKARPVVVPRVTAVGGVPYWMMADAGGQPSSSQPSPNLPPAQQPQQPADSPQQPNSSPWDPPT
jgi:hypothetical protein